MMAIVFVLMCKACLKMYMLGLFLHFVQYIFVPQYACVSKDSGKLTVQLVSVQSNPAAVFDESAHGGHSVDRVKTPPALMTVDVLLPIPLHKKWSKRSRDVNEENVTS